MVKFNFSITLLVTANMMRVYPVLIFVLILSCTIKNNHKNPASLPDNYLDFLETISLPLDEYSTYEFFNYRAKEDTLIVLNLANYSLDFYDLAQKSFLNRIKVPGSGPTGISRLYSFIYHNKDSIFFLPQFNLNGGIILNYKGEFLDRVKASKVKSEIDGYVNHVSSAMNPSYIKENKIWFATYSFTDQEILKGDSGIEYALDLPTGKIETIEFIQKPNHLKGKMWVSNGFSRIMTDSSNWIYSWDASDSVYFFKMDSTGENIQAISLDGGIKSKNAPLKNSTTTEEELLETAKSMVYGKILLDEMEEVIHRVKYLPMKNPEEILTGNSNPYLIKDFEILSYKLDGTFLGKTIFKGGIYDPRVIFIHSGKIYLPRINPNFNKLEEESIHYDIYGKN